MELSDVNDVVKIAERTWGTEYYETPEVFAQRLDWWPAGCWMYENKGYIISHPAQVNNPPKLNSHLTYEATDCYHIHDINLLPELRGQHIADIILEKFWAWPVITLLSANNTEQYWQQKGFTTKSSVAYGQYMIKRK